MEVAKIYANERQTMLNQMAGRRTRQLAGERETHQDSVDRLREIEWQRWTPGLGIVRFFKDVFVEDNSTLIQMHSLNYNLANILYNLGTVVAPVAIAVNYFAN